MLSNEVHLFTVECIALTGKFVRILLDQLESQLIITMFWFLNCSYKNKCNINLFVIVYYCLGKRQKISNKNAVMTCD